MRLFLTGHTGFKGSWFVSCAARAGVDVFGYSLEPTPGGYFEVGRVADQCAAHTIGDIRDRFSLSTAITASEPDVIVHMAAQPLVRLSYRQPRDTFEVNVMGTLNLLEIAQASACQDVLVITSDKVYRNVGATSGYTEDAPLGGHDPYSASKAMTEILVHSWAQSFGSKLRAIQTARAGNVIGGGDRSADRLLPDVVRAISNDQPVVLRYPHAVRPWQHVLDAIAGYAAILRNLDRTSGSPDGATPLYDAWNIGPAPHDRLTVEEVAQEAIRVWGRGRIETTDGVQPHEEQMLTLDATKARTELGWLPRLTATDAVAWSVEWERGVHRNESARRLTDQQIASYLELAGDSALSMTAD